MSDRWQDTLETEELQQSPVLDRYNTVNDALQGLIETKTKLSRSFSMLDPDADDDKRREWLNTTVKEKLPELMVKPDYDSDDGAKDTWTMLGVPADGAYESPEDVGDLGAEEIEEINQLSKAAGHTSKQHKAVVELMVGMRAESEKQMGLQVEAADEDLTKLWGSAKEQNISITDELVAKHNELHPEHKLEVLNNAARLFIMDVAKSMTSEPQIFSQIRTPQEARTPAEARDELAEMRRKPIYNNRDGKYSKEERKSFISKYNKLLAEAG